MAKCGIVKCTRTAKFRTTDPKRKISWLECATCAMNSMAVGYKIKRL